MKIALSDYQDLENVERRWLLVIFTKLLHKDSLDLSSRQTSTDDLNTEYPLYAREITARHGLRRRRISCASISVIINSRTSDFLWYIVSGYTKDSITRSLSAMNLPATLLKIPP